MYCDEAQLKKKKSKGKGKGKGKRQRKKTNKDSESDEEDDDESDEDDDDDNDSSESESESDEKTTSSGRKIISKKRLGKSAIVQTPTIPKGPSRAERALNRSKGPVGPSTSASGLSVTPKKAAEPKKAPEAKKPVAPKTPAAKSPVASTSAGPSGQSKAKGRGNFFFQIIFFRTCPLKMISNL